MVAAAMTQPGMVVPPVEISPGVGYNTMLFFPAPDSTVSG
jgi:hypothetical protein